ncbi:MAG: dienelactone hydrolase family protein [Alphaproteobacteria bacterium]
MRRAPAFIISCLIAIAVCFFTEAASAATRKIDARFSYGGRSIRVEIFRPAGSGVAPAALVLHGASGVGRGWFVYPFAKALAAQGVAAAVVHYYDGLGKRRGKASPRIFETRDRILEAAIDYVLSRPDIRSDGLGIYGMSLGGFHALSLGVRDRRVRAVVSLGGGLSGHIPEKNVRRLPPTLLLHGSRDRVVPLVRALKISKAMERFGIPVQLKVYQGEGHSFSRRAHTDAVAAVARFLSRGLRGPRRLAESVRR